MGAMRSSQQIKTIHRQAMNGHKLAGLASAVKVEHAANGGASPSVTA